MGFKGNLQLMKEMNTAMLMNLLHRKGTTTRAELTKATKLSPTTVSSLVEDLIRRGLVEEVGEKPAAGAGRRAISLRINKDGGYVIGISLGNRKLIGAVLNLHGECVAECFAPIATGNDSLAEQIREALEACLGQVESAKRADIRGIGISAPGIIDERSETVLFSSLLKLNDFNPRREIASYFPDAPIRIVNDANAAAFAEHYAGAGKGKTSLVYVTMNEGIGAGIILDSRIHSGYGGAAGEIGHITVDPGGEVCNCGQRGCVETVLTGPFILRRAQAVARELGEAAPADFDEVLGRYDAGEAWLEPIFDRIAATARLTIASMVQMISPEVVVIEGWPNRSEKLSGRLRAELERLPFPFRFTSGRVLPSAFGEKGALYGAATLMLQRIFSASAWDKSGGYRS